MSIRLAEYLRKSRAEENMDTEQVLARHHETLTEYVAARPELEIAATYKEVKSGESLYARSEMLRLLSAGPGQRQRAGTVDGRARGGGVLRRIPPGRAGGERRRSLRALLRRGPGGPGPARLLPPVSRRVPAHAAQ